MKFNGYCAEALKHCLRQLFHVPLNNIFGVHPGNVFGQFGNRTMNYDQENHKKNQQILHILPFMKPMSPPKKGTISLTFEGNLKAR